MRNNPNNNRNQKGKNLNQMQEEFGAETDVNAVKQQNQKAEAKKKAASGTRAQRFENGTR